tara:strand:- start:86 stop:913 length:828 start_codon:yes stop_codon:yes gene_type:complete
MIKKILNFFRRYRFKLIRVSNIDPITKIFLGTNKMYQNLLDESFKTNFNNIADLEKEYGFSVDENWLNNLALKTQISIKKSKPNFQHGRILYACLRNYIEKYNYNNKKITIFETGTSVGFSALCMSRAIKDAKFENYTIYTTDIIPSNLKIYWNKYGDEFGKRTRIEILDEWKEYLENITFLSGDTLDILANLHINRINFAFLDAVHSSKYVKAEFDYVRKRQKVGDLIIFDDITQNQFPDLVKYIFNIENDKDYDFQYLKSTDSRGYAIAKKTK